MSKHGVIHRYSLELEIIQQGQFPSLKKINEHLYNHGFEIDTRTIQRDFEQLRDEFGVGLTYNRNKNGYFVDVKNSINIESFIRFLEIVNTANLLTDTLAESKNALQYISFDTGGGLKGIENLKPLLKAIKNQRIIKFDHNNFHSSKTRNYLLKPYLLKEYLNRWYIVGTFDGFKGFRTFGIERIENLQVQTKTFKPDKSLKPIEMFKQIIGLVYSENSLQKVILSFTPTQGKYVKTLPLHTSQKVMVDNEKEYTISLKVIPNYELTQLILKHGDTVKVIEPKWLVDEIKANLQRTLKNYS